jgi:uncharacterized protein (TIGR03437 family)
MKPLLYLALSVIPAFAQITQISTDGTGQTLVFDTQFRMQGESDATTQQKIYRWQNGVWTRLRVYTPVIQGIVPSGIGSPFVAAGGSVYGWYIFPSHGLFPVVRPRAAGEIFGMTLPVGFTNENLDVSDNGRYVSGWGGCCGETVIPQLFDAQTSTVSNLTVNAQFVRVGSDGSYSYLIDSKVFVKRPGSDEKSFPLTGNVVGLQMSDDARWIAVDASPDQTSANRKLRLISTSDGTVSEAAGADSFGQLFWSLGNARLAYASSSQHRVNLWDPVTRQSQVLMDSTEAIAGLSMSGDGNVLWTVTETNRLTRFDLQAGTRQEILPPLGFSQSPQGLAVPGSAMLLIGRFTREQQVVVDGQTWPLSDVNSQGYWFQVPWEWHGQTGRTRDLFVRTAGNPFENVSSITYYADYGPYFPTMIDSGDLRFSATMIAAHSDFHGVVSSADPARGGELIHIYLTGLGALQRPVPTGVPGPFDGVPTVQQYVCAGQNVDTLVRTDLLKVPAVVYAGGMIGIYQLELFLPADVPSGSWQINCWDGIREFGAILRTKP